MKKFFTMLFMATVLSVMFTACGDDKDEPVVPETQEIESLDQNENDAHFKFDINTENDLSSIYIYNVKFSERMPVTVNIRIDAPCTVDKSGKVYTFAGTDIIPYLLHENTPVPAPSYIITDLTCTVDTKKKTYDIFFKANGGQYQNSGKLK